ncbi:hypothetical protein QBC44DRAFT_380343 [Cladorrhinum sp. PSN332]|nr:hypothetical protein QBC44DRAFT_380343 [Cladorrhinum sp. PSN332]
MADTGIAASASCPFAGSNNGQHITQPGDFRFLPSDFRHDDGPSTPPSDNPPLGILSLLEGKAFRGTGFNMIFRPNSGPPPLGTSFRNPISPPAPQGVSNNVLELNLMTETWTFSTGIGIVPNRGLGSQGNINLNAIQYLQTVNDVTNPHTGKADGRPTGIHVENGMFMHVPKTTVNPKLATTIARGGTIPHGVVINLQGLEPLTFTPGPPTIPSISTVPFLSTPPFTQQTNVFKSLDATDQDTPRIPQDLTLFLEQGTITQEMLNDPASVLRDVNSNRHILKTATLVMSSINNSPSSLGIKSGGGVAGISFLAGDSDVPLNPNALPVQVDFTLWIEVVKYHVPIPACPKGKKVEVEHEGILFVFSPPKEIEEPGATVTVLVEELQYSQVVFLQFGGLVWPHPTVATLKPEKVCVGVSGDAWGDLDE